MEIPEGAEGSADFLAGEENHRGKVFFEVIRTLEGGSYYRRNHRKQREMLWFFPPSCPFIFCLTLAKNNGKTKDQGA